MATFRAKRIDNDNWIEGLPISANGKTYVVDGTPTVENGVLTSKVVEVVPETVSEFAFYENSTNDKKVELWENDLITAKLDKDYSIVGFVHFNKLYGPVVKGYIYNHKSPLRHMPVDRGVSFSLINVVGNRFEKNDEKIEKLKESVYDSIEKQKRHLENLKTKENA
jgi:hypothetical protein